MNDNPVKDDIAFYFMWKSKIEQNELPLPDSGTETVSKLSRRLSIATSLSNTMSGSLIADKKRDLKTPRNIQIDLINKWKAVEKADDDLENIRRQHVAKTELFEKRWREVEKGQLQLKQNLVKFNNFVKEKKMKVEEGIERSKKENEISNRKYEELKNLETEYQTLLKAKDVLKDALSNKIKYKVFLDSVIEDETSKFPSVEELMKRCESLFLSKEKLEAHLKAINDEITRDADDLEKFKESKMGLLLDYNIKLADLQHIYSKEFVKSMEKKRYLENIEEKKVEKG